MPAKIWMRLRIIDKKTLLREKTKTIDLEKKNQSFKIEIEFVNFLKQVDNKIFSAHRSIYGHY